MLDNIMDFIAWAIIINVFASIYVFLVARLLPHFLFTSERKKIPLSDRGLKKYVFPDGRGVVYEPAVKYRGFLKKYLLFEYKGKKYIKCHLSDDVDSLRYEAALYDNQDRLIKVIEIAENITKRCETKSTPIPKEASYACVVLKKVNETEVFDSLKRFSIKKIAIFAAITTAMTVIYGALIRKLLLFIIAYSGGDVSISARFNVVSSIIVGVILVLLCIVIYKKRIFGKE